MWHSLASTKAAAIAEQKNGCPYLFFILPLYVVHCSRLNYSANDITTVQTHNICWTSVQNIPPKKVYWEYTVSPSLGMLLLVEHDKNCVVWFYKEKKVSLAWRTEISGRIKRHLDSSLIHTRNAIFVDHNDGDENFFFHFLLYDIAHSCCTIMEKASNRHVMVIIHKYVFYCVAS